MHLGETRMNGTRFIATAALLAGVAFAHSAAAQQSMYRCGNKYQDKPCEGGEKGRVVGTTGTPKPAAPAAGSESPERAAEREREDAWGRNVRASMDASTCVRLRKQSSKTRSYQQKETYDREMRRLDCAHVGAGGLDKERRCADARSEEERAEACAAYEEARPKSRKH
jgi:hypothetical protein